MHILKLGDKYLTATGDLSDRQADALRIMVESPYDNGPAASDIRVVRLTKHGSHVSQDNLQPGVFDPPF